MKHILICSTAYLPFVGGAEVAIKELTDRMSDIEFDLITARLERRLPSAETIGNVRVHRIGLGIKLDKFLLPLLGLPSAIQLHKKHHYSYVWAMMASQASVLAVFIAKLKKIPLLTTLQEGDEEEHLERYAFGSGVLFKLFIRPWHRLAITSASQIQVISEYLEERAKKAGTRAPITIIPNGVDIERFSKKPSSEELGVLMSKLGISSDHTVILTVSRLVKKNGVDLLIKAIPSLKDTRPSIKLLVVGSGKEEGTLRQLTKELGLEDSVIFHGNVSNEELPKYIHLADVFVRPSRSEGQGISFIEAMAAGVPIIAAPVGGIVDFLNNRETGLFCEAENPESITNALKELLANDSLREKMVTQSQELVKEKYDWDILAQHMRELFN